MDRQNRVGSKFGGGGVSSQQQSERERKERLKQLALESIDLAKDPYLVRNHLGSYECKLCFTLHRDESNYLSHTQGKKHQQGLARRAHLDKLKREQEERNNNSSSSATTPGAGGTGTSVTIGGQSSSTTNTNDTAGGQQRATKRIKIGRPAYQVLKNRHVDTNQRCLSFELSYPDIEVDLQPRHRIMTAYEQRIEPVVPAIAESTTGTSSTTTTTPRSRYQYLLFAAAPYETVAFKIPNEPIDKDMDKFVTHWDEETKKFTLTLHFVEKNNNINQ